MKHRDEGLRKICGHEELRQLVQEALAILSNGPEAEKLSLRDWLKTAGDMLAKLNRQTA